MVGRGPADVRFSDPDLKIKLPGRARPRAGHRTVAILEPQKMAVRRAQLTEGRPERDRPGPKERDRYEKNGEDAAEIHERCVVNHAKETSKAAVRRSRLLGQGVC